jgi:hypothetical protein
MFRVPGAGGQGFVVGRALVRLLAGRDLRSVVRRPATAAALRAALSTGDGSPARVSFIGADRDHDARRLDLVAGSEFIDDRIRLRD